MRSNLQANRLNHVAKRLKAAANINDDPEQIRSHIQASTATMEAYRKTATNGKPT